MNVLLVRYMDEASCAPGLGVTVRLGRRDGGYRKVTAAKQNWKKAMGGWDAVSWAWYAALLFRKLALPAPVNTCTLQYKLQDRPDPGRAFSNAVQHAFIDVCRTSLLSAHAASFCGASFDDPFYADVDRSNDLALFFDATLWSVARDLGFGVEDRSASPAFTYCVGATDVWVVDHTGRRFDSAASYVRARLSASPLHPDLSAEDALMHTKYLLELLSTQALGTVEADDEAVPKLGVLWEKYSRFCEKRLGRRLRRIAAKYGAPVPAVLAESCLRRCSNCNKAEGEAVKEDGEAGARLMKCPCRTNYCNALCQRAGALSRHPFFSCSLTFSSSQGGKSIDEYAPPQPQQSHKHLPILDSYACGVITHASRLARNRLAVRA